MDDGGAVGSGDKNSGFRVEGRKREESWSAFETRGPQNGSKGSCRGNEPVHNLALQLGCKLEESRLGEGRNEAHIFDLS